MKEKKIDAIEVWKELDALAPRLGLSVIDRTVYLHLLRLTHVEGRRSRDCPPSRALRRTGA